MAIQIQIRRGTATQWTSANPVLASGEIAFETDTNKIKMGDGSTAWTSLEYATLTPTEINSAVSGAIANVIGSAPEALDTLNELAAAINDDPEFFSNITGVVTTHANLTADVHGISNTANLVYVADLTSHADDTTNIHGIADTSVLETTTGAQSKATAAQVASASYTDTVAAGLEAEIAQVDFKTVTNLNSINDVDDRVDDLVTALASTDANVTSLSTSTSNSIATLNTLVSDTADNLTEIIQANKDLLDANVTTVSNTINDHANLTTSVHGIANTAALETTTGAQGKADAAEAAAIDHANTTVETHANVTTSVHGISNTANLVYVADLTSHADDTTSVHGIADTSVLLTTAGGTLTDYLTLHADPSQAMHAVSKQYVDNVSSGILAKPAVKVATTEALTATYDNGTDGAGATLTATSYAPFPTVDGETLSTVNGDRGILVKNQTDPAENGRYNLTTQGDTETPWVLTRCGLCDTADEIPGMYLFVTDGTANGGTSWVANVDDVDTFAVGTDDIDFFQFSGAGTYTANSATGIELSATTFSINTSVISTVASLTSHAEDANGIHGVTGNVVGDTDTQTLTNKTLTSPAVDTPTLTLDTNSSTTSGRLSYDSTNKKLVIGDGSVARPIATSLVVTNAQNAGYTLVLADADNLVEMSGGGTLTVPANSSVAYPVGTQIDLLQAGASQVTVAGAGGVTVNGTPGLKLRTQWSSARLVKRATDTWVLLGDLSA